MEVEWHYCEPGQVLKKVTLSDFVDKNGASFKGKRSLVDLGTVAPVIPSQYAALGYCCYNRLKDTFYYFIQDNQTTMPTLKVLRCGPSRVFEEFTATALQDIINSCMATNRYFTAGRESNMLIDVNGDIYLNFMYSLPGGHSTCTIKINEQTMAVSKTTINAGPYWGTKFFGYDDHFGYYVSTGGVGYAYSTVISSKSPIDSVTTEYGADQYFGGRYHRWNLALNSANGLVAYTQTTPVFIGGRYEIVSPKSIALQANSNNHIFAKRGPDGVLTITNRSSSALQPGETTFDTVLVATIVTDSSNPVSTTYYNIN